MQRGAERTLALLTRTPAPDERRALASAVARAVTEQMSGVESRLLPLVRNIGPRGEELADRQVGWHTELKAETLRLRSADATSDAFDRVQAQLLQALQDSGEHLESMVLPALREAQVRGDRLDRPASPRPRTARLSGHWRTRIAGWIGR